MKSRFLPGIGILAASAALVLPMGVATATPSSTEQTAPDPNSIQVDRWDEIREFRRGTLDGLKPGRGRSLTIHPRAQEQRTYTDPFGDGTAKTYDTGTWTSPVVELDFEGDEAIASWNAQTPTGTFVETKLRGRKADGTWTKWYVMGRWASGDDFEAGDIHRTSVEGQNDDDAAIWTDTLAVRSGHELDAYQAQATLYRPEGERKVSPRLDGMTVLTNEYIPTQDAPETSEPTLGRHVELDVPPYAQNIHKGEYPEYGGGGQVWCSPTSTTMVQYYWGEKYQVAASELADIEAPNGDPQVAYAAINTWDYTYEGAGNWPFNAAYAHTFGLDSFVTRLRSLAEAERFVEAGIPVIISLAWELEEMPEAGYGSNGHLMVLVGFTEDGDPILNDPATNRNDDVRNVYTRENFEKVWQKANDGVVYIYHPSNVDLPKNVEDVTPNW
ncbi:MAG: C39 family peptidase [Propionibacteriaceae bacterium]